MSATWFLTPQRLPSAPLQLFCIPYAGASAAVFRRWADALAPHIELLAVELPAHGWRVREAPASDLGTLATALAEAIASVVRGPYAIFGHSFGAWLGLETARRLEAQGLAPHRLFASGRQAPSLGNLMEPLSHLDDPAFVAAVQHRYGAIPPQVMAEPELLAMLLPALRSDLAMIERYVEGGAGVPDTPSSASPEIGSRTVWREPLGTPIVSLVGASDTMVPVHTLAPWAQETTADHALHVLEGGHFYFQPEPAAVLALLRQYLLGADARASLTEALAGVASRADAAGDRS